VVCHGIRDWYVFRVKEEEGVEVGKDGKNDLLEEPLDVNDTLSVIPVGELSENVLGEIDVGGRTA